MRIAFVIEHFSASKGGGEGYAALLSREASKAGHDIHIYASSFEDPGYPVNYHEVSIAKHPRVNRDKRFDQAICAELSRAEFDLIHSFSRISKVDVTRPGGGCHLAWMKYDLLSFRSPIKRFIRSISRSFSPRNKSMAEIEKKCYHSAKKIIAVSNMVKNHITEFYPEVADKIVVVHNGVDLNKYNYEEIHPQRGIARTKCKVSDQVAILFVANNFRLKGLETLVRACGDYKDQVCILAAGKGRSGKYASLARKKGVQINFIGPVSDMRELYAAADIVCHPTFYDPFSNVTLEGMASGLPVITSGMNGASEIIEQGIDGYVVEDPADWKGFSNCIGELLGKKTREMVSEKAIEKARQFDIKFNAEKILRIFEEVAGS